MKENVHPQTKERCPDKTSMKEIIIKEFIFNLAKRKLNEKGGAHAPPKNSCQPLMLQ